MATRRGHGDGTIYFEEKRQRWVGAIDLGRDANGKRLRPRVVGPPGDRSKAARDSVRDRLRELQAQHAAGLPTGDRQLTVGEWLERWLAEVLPARETVRSSNTVDNYTWAVRKHLIPALGPKKLRQLTPDDVDAMLRQKAADGMSRSSMNRIRSVLVAALRQAERRGKIVRNVAALVDTPAGPQSEARAMTVEQAEKLLEVIRGDRLEALFMTGLMLGLRPGELLGLTWEDVDLDAATMQIRRSLKREKTGLRLGDPKTPKSRRGLDLPAPVVGALHSHRARQLEDRLAAGPEWHDHDLVFTASFGQPIDPSNLRRHFDKLTKQAGLGHWQPKELRHSAASLLSAAGVPLELVADVLGHDGLRMTKQVYRHAVAPTVNAAKAPMERLFARLQSAGIAPREEVPRHDRSDADELDDGRSEPRSHHPVGHLPVASRRRVDDEHDVGDGHLHCQESQQPVCVSPLERDVLAPVGGGEVVEPVLRLYRLPAGIEPPPDIGRGRRRAYVDAGTR